MNHNVHRPMVEHCGADSSGAARTNNARAILCRQAPSQYFPNKRPKCNDPKCACGVGGRVTRVEQWVPDGCETVDAQHQSNPRHNFVGVFGVDLINQPLDAVFVKIHWHHLDGIFEHNLNEHGVNKYCRSPVGGAWLTFLSFRLT